MRMKPTATAAAAGKLEHSFHYSTSTEAGQKNTAPSSSTFTGICLAAPVLQFECEFKCEFESEFEFEFEFE